MKAAAFSLATGLVASVAVARAAAAAAAAGHPREAMPSPSSTREWTGGEGEGAAGPDDRDARSAGTLHLGGAEGSSSPDGGARARSGDGRGGSDRGDGSGREGNGGAVVVDDDDPLCPLSPPDADGLRKTLNVHLVPHTHDDVGWLKTVDQYFYGRNNTIQHAQVNLILDSVLAQLLDPRAPRDRTFTYVESKFLSMWHSTLPEESKRALRGLVAEKRFSVANGGWCMHDEANAHFVGMIDQTTLGHRFLREELGAVPAVGWQIDPFGHSATQGSLMTSGFGFDALYFGRIHHVDLQHRHASADCEGLWTSSADESSVFWGLTGSYMGNYGGPAGFCFDVLCGDDPLVGESEDELVERIKNFTSLVAAQAERTKGRNLMLTMGMDFFYEEADKNFENLDLLIEATNRLFEEGIVDPSDYFGERFDEVKVFYSTPERYTKCKYADSLLLSSRGDDDDDVAADFASAPPTKHDPAGWKDHAKTGDFFPYADCEHCYWSGYFSSRQGLKRMERVGSSFLHAARQVESLTKLRSSDSLVTSDEALAAGSSSSWNASPLYPLEDAVAIAQHHDAVAGTSKQHVAYDYAKRIAEGIGEASAFATEGLRELLLEPSSEALENLSYCHLLNETVCDVSQVASQKGDEVIYVVAYNALAHTRSEVIPLPMDSDADYIVEELNADDWSAVSSSLIPNPNHARSPSGAHFTLHFEAKELPPLGASVFRVRKTVGPYQSVARRATESTPRRGDIPSRRLRTTPNFPRDELLSQPEDDLILSNGALSVAFDRLTGTIKSISQQREDGVSVRLQQEYGFYEAFARDESFNTLITEFEAGPSLKSRTPWLLGTDDPPQNAGAYIFRPTLDQSFYALPPSALPDSVVVHESDLVTEVHAEFGNPPWIKQITRLMDGKDYVDVEYAVGPVPIDDGVGKEVISRYSTTIESGGIFYTDSNGREFVKRRRGDARVFGYDTPDFNPEIEPIAGNYYPVNTAMYLEDQSSSFTILTDRSQGGSSLSDGSLELMIQRRLLHDDARGVGEPLNETDIGITHCIDPPPKCNVTRLGEGVTVKGSHRLMIGRNGATQARAQMDNVFSQPHIFVASEPHNSHVPFRHPNLSLSKESLDRRIMVVTFAALEEENAFLVRLAHQYGKDEIMDEAPGVQSGPALVDMQDLFPDREIVSITEKTLSANQDRSDWESRRFQWDPDSTRDVGATVPGADFTVMLKPLEIRTFEISIR